MNTPAMALAADLTGSWRGTNRLWLDPSAPPRESTTTARVHAVAGDMFLEFRYTWVDDGLPQDGLILLACTPDPGGPAMAWVDSWHMRQTMMVLAAEPHEAGVCARGSYAAPEGPDWGWRISLEPASGGRLRLAMFNITPDGEAFHAVEAIYDRVPDAATEGAT